MYFVEDGEVRITIKQKVGYEMNKTTHSRDMGQMVHN